MMMPALDWLGMRARPARHSSMPDPLRIPLSHLTAQPDPSQRFRLMEVVRRKLRERRYSRRTEEAYIYWIRRYVVYHDRRHPRDLGETDVTGFLSMLAVTDNVAASTQSRRWRRSNSCMIACLTARSVRSTHQPQRVAASVFRWFSASARGARSWPRCRSRPGSVHR